MSCPTCIHLNRDDSKNEQCCTQRRHAMSGIMLVETEIDGFPLGTFSRDVPYQKLGTIRTFSLPPSAITLSLI